MFYLIHEFVMQRSGLCVEKDLDIFGEVFDHRGKTTICDEITLSRVAKNLSFRQFFTTGGEKKFRVAGTCGTRRTNNVERVCLHRLECTVSVILEQTQRGLVGMHYTRCLKLYNEMWKRILSSLLSTPE